MNIIELNIEQLVLHGFNPGDRHHIRQALELELTHLLSTKGVPSFLAISGEYERIDGGQFNASRGAKAWSIGSQIAQSVYAGFIK